MKAKRHSFRRESEARQRATDWFARHRLHIWGHRFKNGKTIWATAGKGLFVFDAPLPGPEDPHTRGEALAWQRRLYQLVANEARVTVLWALPERPDKMTECVEPGEKGER